MLPHRWMYIFYLSKFYEMIDTYVLGRLVASSWGCPTRCNPELSPFTRTAHVALKKKPLTFLQMYHHSSIVFLTWVGQRCHADLDATIFPPPSLPHPHPHPQSMLAQAWLESRWTLAWYGMAFNTLVHTFSKRKSCWLCWCWLTHGQDVPPLLSVLVFANA